MEYKKYQRSKIKYQKKFLINNNMDKTIVLVTGLVGVIFTLWFFFGKKQIVVEAGDEIDILVKGGYSPDVISIARGRKTKINFLRTDNNTCLEEVILSDFKIKRYLPINEKVSMEIIPDKTGEYQFSCGMGMFHGKIIVK